jgi:RNA polymerase sigma factor (sigma-70 family)
MKLDDSVNPELSIKVESLLKGCLKNDRKSQKMFYEHFFAYGMSICLRYTNSRSEATEVLNEAFMKIFTKLEMYDVQKSLKGWIRRIMINTSIDYYRQNHRYSESEDIDNAVHVSATESTLSNISYNEIINEIQELTPAYRNVFNLYVIDGYKHEEIAEQLGISVGTSKSNLSRARAILQQRLAKLYTHEQTSRLGGR